MHKKLAIIYFNLSILIINKLTLNSADPFLLKTSHLPPFFPVPIAIGSYREPQGGKALHASPYCLSNVGIVISSCLNEPPFPPDSYRDPPRGKGFARATSHWGKAWLAPSLKGEKL